MVEVLNPHHAHGKDAPMVHATPTQVLLTSTLPSLVMQLSGSLARAVSLLDQWLSHEPTPQAMATFERELSVLLREVGHWSKAYGRSIPWSCAWDSKSVWPPRRSPSVSGAGLRITPNVKCLRCWKVTMACTGRVPRSVSF